MKIKFSKMLILGIFITMFFVPVNVLAATDVTDETTLKQALTNGETEINLKNDIVLSNDVGTHATRTVGLEVKGEDTITINGNGHTLSTSLIVAMEVRANTGKDLKLVLNDITVIGTERAIDTRSSGISLELNKTNLSVTKYGNYQALTIGGNAGPINVDINNNSTIDGGQAGYGIITFNPVNMTINDSTVKGYAALFMKDADNSEGSAGSVVIIENSVVEGNSKYSGSSDNFGTIVLHDKNINIKIVNSLIKSVNTGTAYQVPFVLSSEIANVPDDEKNVITVEGESEFIVDTQIDDESLVLNYDNNKMDIVVKSGVKSNIQIEKEYLEEGTETIIDEETGEIIVVNKKENIPKDTTKENITNPKTNDNIINIVIMAIISLVGVTGTVFYSKKRYN